MGKTMNEREFKLAISEIRSLLLQNRRNLKKIADLLGRMTHKMLREVRKTFPQFTTDHLSRLAAWGRGEMAEHLAIRDESVNYTSFVKLKKENQKLLNNANHELEIATVQGVKRIKVKDAQSHELRQVIDTTQGSLLSAAEQHIRTAAEMAEERKAKKKNTPVDDMEKVKSLHIRGKSVIAEFEHITGTIPIRMLTKLLGSMKDK